jgi:hypothetical protein
MTLLKHGFRTTEGFVTISLKENANPTEIFAKGMDTNLLPSQKGNSKFFACEAASNKYATVCPVYKGAAIWKSELVCNCSFSFKCPSISPYVKGAVAQGLYY